MDRLALVVLLLCALGFAHATSYITKPRNNRPSLQDIELVRESWKTVYKNSSIPINTLTELIKAHPEVKEASPLLKDVPIEDLAKTPAFVKRAFFYYSFSINFIVNTMDDEAVLRDSLQRMEAVAGLYPPIISLMAKESKENVESVKFYFYLLELKKAEPKMTPETLQAWTNCLNYAISFLGKEKPQNPVSSTSVLTPEELSTLQVAFKVNESKFANTTMKTLRRFFEYHPMIFKTFQESIPIMVKATFYKELNENDSSIQFLAFNLICATSMIIMNADNDELLVKMIKKNSKPENLANYVDPKYRFDEFRRLFMETAWEEGASREHINAFNKIFEHTFDVMAHHLKSNEKPIASFFAQRDTNVFAEKSYIYYTYLREHHNNCFNITTGVFTAPVKGVYSFSFNCVKMKEQVYAEKASYKYSEYFIGDHAKLTVSMRKINVENNTSYPFAVGHLNSQDRYGWFPLNIQAIISLEENEKVAMFLEQGFIYSETDGDGKDNERRTNPGWTSFTGFFLHD